MPLYLSEGSLDREIDRARRVRRGAARRRCRLPHLEPLETRITPSTWTGAGANANWSTAANWSGGTPTNGSSLVFPAGVTQLNAVNDLAAGTTFSSIEIDGSGYALSGHALGLSQGITTTYTSGTSSDSIDTQLGGTVSVAAGGELDLSGALTSAGGLTVAGGGTLGLGGSTSNTYVGTTTVNGSILILSKSGGAIAVPGNLVIGDGTSVATVRETAAGEIATNANVTINDKATLDLNGQNNTIGTLNLSGATVSTGTGTLTLGGNITANDPASEDASSISGKLDLGGTSRTITVAEPSADTAPADVDLTISAVISDSTTGLTVTGGGTADLSGANTYTGLTTIGGTGTTLLVDGTVGPVRVGAGDTLGGSGTVGDVAAIGGTVSPGDGNGPLKTGALTLDGSSTFAPQLNGPASVAFGQALASGAVTLNGALSATLGGGYVPAVGDQLTIIRNTSGSGVSGTFTGLPEGSNVTIASHLFKISYQGGAGHDVVLTALGLPTSIAVAPSTQTSTYGQSVTFTATVSGQGVQALGGAVSFYDGNPASGGTLLGTGPVNGQHQAIFASRTLNVANSPHSIYAVYSGSPSYAGSTTAQPASITINPATVTASLVGTVSKTYDGTTAATLTAANFQLSGVVGNDVVTLSPRTTGTYGQKDVGANIPVTVTGLSITGANAGNYVLGSTTAVGNVGLINALPLTVTGITAQNKVYDGTTSATIDTSGATLTGVLPGDTVSLVTTGAIGTFSDKLAGIGKTVNVAGLSLSGPNAGDYTIAAPGVSANITPAPLTVTANPATMTYGGTVPNLTFTATGLVGTDTVASALSGTLATTATSRSHVGTYPITQGSLAATNVDYTITFNGAPLSVTPAPLTITANAAGKVYGAPVPAFTASYSGFKNNDTAASLASLPSLTTSATATSSVGAYPINVTGGTSGDYTITDVPGTLTVTKASTSAGLSGSLSTSQVGQAVGFSVKVAPVSPGAGSPTGTVTFSVDGTPVASAPVDPATGLATFSDSTLGRGPHTITATYSGDSNFATSQSGSAQETVSSAGTQSTLTVQAIRNGRGKIIKVELRSQVLVVSPGVGVPTGVVGYFRKGRLVKTVALSGGRAELTLKANQALRKPFTVRYVGDGNFNASTSSPVVPTSKALAVSARPRA